MTKHEFKAVEGLQLENSFGVLNAESDIELNVSIGIGDADEHSWFEFYDEKTGGDDWYGEGILEIEDGAVTGYDGVFGLPVCIVDKLRELGFNVDEIE